MKKFINILFCILLGSCNMSEMQNVRFVTDKDGVFLYCICSDSDATELSWDYPVKPGMPEWKLLKYNVEMSAACQIPENILSFLSTKELMFICLQYPLLFDIFAFNIPDIGIDVLFNDFNGIRELFKRDDCEKELLNLYNCQIQNCSLLKNEDMSVSDKGSLIYLIYTLEYLLSRANDNYKEILQSLVVGYENQLKYHPDYISNLSKNFFSRGHIIDKMCKQCLTEEQKNIIFGSFVLEEEMDVLNKFSYQLIK